MRDASGFHRRVSVAARQTALNNPAKFRAHSILRPIAVFSGHRVVAQSGRLANDPVLTRLAQGRAVACYHPFAMSNISREDTKERHVTF